MGLGTLGFEGDEGVGGEGRSVGGMWKGVGGWRSSGSERLDRVGGEMGSWGMEGRGGAEEWRTGVEA